MLKSLKDLSEAKEAEKDEVIVDEHDSGVREQSQSELNNAIGEESTQRSPIADNAGKNLNPGSDSLERVGSTEILLNSGEGAENVVTPRRKGDVHVEESRPEEINEYPASPMFHKVKLRGHVFKFNSTLINKHYGFRDEGATTATLKLGDIIEELNGKLAYNSASNYCKEEDGLGENAKPLTISDKLMKGKDVIDVEFNAVDQPEPVPEIEAAELKAKIDALKSRVPPAVNASAMNPEPVATTSANPPVDAEADGPGATDDETSTSHV
ncbi:hypothetical protein LIER_10201 [Lithospermum erythrorhizon]|uniref:Uncharacterized protein n=1 Tax=Lithospermum erythrorhizon TaxID=34254 RepID=A0AAV3PIC9_LITER